MLFAHFQHPGQLVCIQYVCLRCEHTWLMDWLGDLLAGPDSAPITRC